MVQFKREVVQMRQINAPIDHGEVAEEEHDNQHIEVNEEFAMRLLTNIEVVNKPKQLKKRLNTML